MQTDDRQHSGVSERPDGLGDTGTKPADDGLFGPESVTWRVMASPASSVGTATAVLAQMLHPKVARLLVQASTFERNPELRGRLTAEYGMTVTYGDIQSAEQAGQTLRALHSRMKAVDPDTGKHYAADERDLLFWVHATIPWALLRACHRWGPALSEDEQDRFVREQRTAARLVGLDPEAAPGSLGDLQAYIDTMMPRLAYTTAAGRIRAIMVPRTVPRTGSELLTRMMALAAVDLLPQEMRQLYGYWWGPVQRGLLSGVSSPLVRAAVKKTPYERALPQLREHASAHAFGARALKINAELRRKHESPPAATTSSIGSGQPDA